MSWWKKIIFPFVLCAVVILVAIVRRREEDNYEIVGIWKDKIFLREVVCNGR